MYEALLARVRLFQTLAQRELTWLSEGCRERDFAASTALVRAGQSSSTLLILLHGSVAPLLRRADGSEHLTGHFGPGTVIGEMALCGAPAQHTMVALEHCTALVLPQRDFEATLREWPEIAIKLLAVVSERLRQLERSAPATSLDLYTIGITDTHFVHDPQEAN